MNKTKTILVMVMTIFILGLASCNKDKNKNTPTPTPAPDIAAEVAGTYNGMLTYSVAGTAYDPVETNVTVAKTSENTVSITFPQIGEGMMTIREITVPGITVSTDDHVVYTFSETEINQTVGTTNYVGTLNGEVNGDNITLDWTVTPGAMPMPIVFNFVGKK